jgi:aspartate oxidase
MSQSPSAAPEPNAIDRAAPADPAAPPVVIVGAGLAGLTVALHLADRHPVVLLAKRGFD